jgi:hypothetical protein
MLADAPSASPSHGRHLYLGERAISVVLLLAKSFRRS